MNILLILGSIVLVLTVFTFYWKVVSENYELALSRLKNIEGIDKDEVERLISISKYMSTLRKVYIFNHIKHALPDGNLTKFKVEDIKYILRKHTRY